MSSEALETGAAEAARADVWLWAVRLYKTRSLAADACRKGQVSIGGQRVKPARHLRPGDEIAVEKGGLTLTIAVRAALNRRVGAKEVPQYLEDRTPGEVRQAAAEIRQFARLASPEREDGSGRPTKRERREMDDLIAEAEDRRNFFDAMTRAVKRSRLIATATIFLLGQLGNAADPPRRSFEPAAGIPTLKLSENLTLSAEKLAPETDPSTGDLKGLSASGRVVIQLKPKGAGNPVVVACDKAEFRAAGDEIVLTGWPAVKSGPQILRATGAETFVRVVRATGKWEIKGPHRIELNLKR